MSYTTVDGKYGIRAKVLAKSRSAVTGAILITFEIEYPRLILAELNTHRDKSRNSASSRAIPFLKMLQQLTARPVRFGEANPGMQDKGEDYDKKLVLSWTTNYEGYDPAGPEILTADEAWDHAKGSALQYAKAFYDAGYHKQVYNRLVEPFQMMKTVISGTEWANFFWLRDHGAADPTIAELARVMKEADDLAPVQVLEPGEWHLPYVELWHDDEGTVHYFLRPDEDPPEGDEPRAITMADMIHLSADDAIKVSCARCAAVSFRNVDYGVEKSREVYDRLVGDDRKHASAFEHCATPMQPRSHEAFVNVPSYPSTWEAGISHMDRQKNLWSGNLKGFIQYRKLIPGENYTGE